LAKAGDAVLQKEKKLESVIKSNEDKDTRIEKLHHDLEGALFLGLNQGVALTNGALFVSVIPGGSTLLSAGSRNCRAGVSLASAEKQQAAMQFNALQHEHKQRSRSGEQAMAQVRCAHFSASTACDVVGSITDASRAGHPCSQVCGFGC
jgi:hypothetical protein